ncbi:unnamed protein product [Musa hybrid cultivar]
MNAYSFLWTRKLYDYFFAWLYFNISFFMFLILQYGSDKTDEHVDSLSGDYTRGILGSNRRAIREKWEYSILGIGMETFLLFFERKKVIKGIKGHVRKLSLDQLGSLLLVCVLSVVDDKKLVTKIVIRELQTMLKELVLDKNGRRTVLQLLHPQCSRYFAPEDLACLSLSAEVTEDPMEVGLEQCQNGEAPMTDNENSEVGRKSVQLDTGGKMDSFRGRCELMVESGLAEGLFETCTDNVGELLRSNFGKEVVYEVFFFCDFLLSCCVNFITDLLFDLVKNIINKIAIERRWSNVSKIGDYYILQQFETMYLSLESSTHTYIDKYKCKKYKCVLLAFLESSVSDVKDLAKPELQPLMDLSVLKTPENRVHLLTFHQHVYQLKQHTILANFEVMIVSRFY